MKCYSIRKTTAKSQTRNVPHTVMRAEFGEFYLLTCDNGVQSPAVIVRELFYVGQRTKNSILREIEPVSLKAGSPELLYSKFSNSFNQLTLPKI